MKSKQATSSRTRAPKGQSQHTAKERGTRKGVALLTLSAVGVNTLQNKEFKGQQLTIAEYMRKHGPATVRSIALGIGAKALETKQDPVKVVAWYLQRVWPEAGYVKAAGETK